MRVKSCIVADLASASDNDAAVQPAPSADYGIRANGNVGSNITVGTDLGRGVNVRTTVNARFAFVSQTVDVLKNSNECVEWVGHMDKRFVLWCNRLRYDQRRCPAGGQFLEAAFVLQKRNVAFAGIAKRTGALND
jgi:hypothetical protein